MCSKSEEAAQKAKFWSLTQQILITFRPNLMYLAVQLIDSGVHGTASLPALARLKHMLAVIHCIMPYKHYAMYRLMSVSLCRTDVLTINSLTEVPKVQMRSFIYIFIWTEY